MTRQRTCILPILCFNLDKIDILEQSLTCKKGCENGLEIPSRYLPSWRSASLKLIFFLILNSLRITAYFVDNVLIAPVTSIRLAKNT